MIVNSFAVVLFCLVRFVKHEAFGLPSTTSVDSGKQTQGLMLVKLSPASMFSLIAVAFLLFVYIISAHYLFLNYNFPEDSSLEQQKT